MPGDFDLLENCPDFSCDFDGESKDVRLGSFCGVFDGDFDLD